MKSNNEVICYSTVCPGKFGGGDTERWSDKWGGKATFQINGVLGGLRVGGFLAVLSDVI